MTAADRANLRGAMDYTYKLYIEQMDCIVALEARMAALLVKPRNGPAYLPDELKEEHRYLRGLEREAGATMQKKYLLYKGLRAELDTIDKVHHFHRTDAPRTRVYMLDFN